MKYRSLIPLFAALTAALASCAKSEPAAPEAPAPETVQITARMASEMAATKIGFTPEDGALVLRWSESDALRVIGESEPGNLFTLVQMNDGGRTAVFSGEAPSGSTFAVQYPATLTGSASAAALFYTGQKQSGNGSTLHLRKNWSARIANLTDYSSIDFSPENQPAGATLSQSGVLKFYLQVPASITRPVSVALISSQRDFYVNYEGYGTNDEGRKTDRLVLELEGIDLAADNRILTAYMATPWKASSVPAGRTLRVQLTDEGGSSLYRDITLTQALTLNPGAVSVIKLNNSGWSAPVYSPQTLYVSPLTGNDSNIGTKESPFKTLPKAFSAAAPGTTIILRGGTYTCAQTSVQEGHTYLHTNFFMHCSGAPGAPITLKAYEGETPVLDGGAGNVLFDEISASEAEKYRHMVYYMSHRKSLSCYAASCNEGGILTISGSHIVLDGLTLTGSPNAGIYCYNGASDITVRNCTVQHCGSSGICFGADGAPSARIKVLDNTVEDCSQLSREAISLRTVAGFEIAGNTLRAVIKESIDAKGGCSDGRIHGNRLVDSGHCGIYLDAGYLDVNRVQRNILVYDNIVDNPYGTGICLASESGNDMEDIRVYNNLVFSFRVKDSSAASNTGCGIKVADNGSSTDGTIRRSYIYHNTVYNMAEQGIYVNYPRIEQLVFANNISWANAANVAVKDGVVDPALVTVEGNFTAAPGFADAAGRDFSLLATSPALNTVTSTTVPGTGGTVPIPDKDLAGNDRPAGVRAEPGCFEYVSPGSGSSTLEDLVRTGGSW